MSTWTQRDVETHIDSTVDAPKAKVLDQEKAASLPKVLKEAGEARPFDQVRLQPVISPGIYEAEFGTKGGDLIFHFWPSGYHDAERADRATPRFTNDFHGKLQQAMSETFEEHRVEITLDADMGAFFVVAKFWADSQAPRELCVKACERLHKLCGGLDG